MIKSELNYNRKALCLATFVTIGIWLLYLIDRAGLYTIFGMPLVLCFAALFGRDAKETRTRQHFCLPVSSRTQSTLKMLLFVVLFNIIMISAWATQAIVERSQLANDIAPFSGLMTFSSLTLIFSFGYLIMQDVRFATVKKKLFVGFI
ncbi:MAG: hypothetical protein ACE5HS_14355 [bacterium]